VPLLAAAILVVCGPVSRCGADDGDANANSSEKPIEITSPTDAEQWSVASRHYITWRSTAAEP